MRGPKKRFSDGGSWAGQSSGRILDIAYDVNQLDFDHLVNPTPLEPGLRLLAPLSDS